MEAYRIIKRSACNIDDCAIGKKIPLIKPINPITVIKRKLETTFEERRKLLFPNLSPRRSGPYVFADLSQEELWTEEILGNTPQDYYLLTTELNTPITWFDANLFNQAGNEALLYELSHNDVCQENYLENDRIVSLIDRYWQSNITTDNPSLINHKLSEGMCIGNERIVNCEIKQWKSL